ncbi:methionine--tRNA ligase [Aeromicrobium sp. 636]|uniref:Methionine--tRNA ligase n=1 Tax=Aeromicrobium senzhongii TaxID=2663859 RepID=A0A8I0K3H6_9ACTN|nr:methionine--tRNA ligase [Aeromicrobium sp. 636]MBC9227560.1 methionine--tRNA ligase [Aeromicrobium senzhongii]MCQ3999657.1 methionine--tRNA ligase [Aeromicrobium sp. 636]
MPEPRFYATTPIYYVNDAPHIGHGYTTTIGDVLTRWHRQRGERVWFLTGVDEHGQKVLRKAEANGVSPQEWVDRLVENEWLPMLQTIDAANDDFIRTTEQRHEKGAQAFWQALHDRGEVYRGEFSGWYSVGSEEFVADEYVADGEGEDEGFKISTLDGSRLEHVTEENYFFPLSKYADKLLELYEARPDFVQPESARNEVLAFVRGGLKDLSISRSTFDWGIPLPWDDSHVMYVWIEALLNYVTAAGYGVDDERFEDLWPANVHLVGKDIVRFHAVIWPALLMAAGLPVPHRVFAHGWLLVGGQKMSKSKANGIHPNEIVATFGSDAYRYYFTRALTFGSDGSISWEDIGARYHAELANGFGNLASRVAAMIGKYFDGELPAAGELGPAEQHIVETVATAVAEADEAMERIAPQDALTAIWRIVDALNLYITESEPWAVAKDESQRERLGTILNTAAEGLRVLAVTLHPVMPKATTSLWESLGAEPDLGPVADQRLDEVATWGRLRPGATVTKVPSLFPRIDLAQD